MAETREFKSFHEAFTSLLLVDLRGEIFRAIFLDMVRRIDDAIGVRYDEEKLKFFQMSCENAKLKITDIDMSTMEIPHLLMFVRTMIRAAKERDDKLAVPLINVALERFMERFVHMLAG